MPKMPEYVEKYMTNLAVKRRSEKTLYQYNQDLLTFCRYLYAVKYNLCLDEEILKEQDVSRLTNEDINSVRAEDIYNYIVYLTKQRGNAAVTICRKVSSVKGFYKFLIVIEHCIDKNPAENIELPKKKKRLPKYLTLEESISLLEAVAKDTDSRYRERNYCVITIFLNCGIRLSELTGISISDLDPELRSMRVIGKGNKERIVYLNDACANAIKDYIAVRGKDGEIKDKNALFISREHRRMSNIGVQKMVEKYFKKAGLEYKHYSVHKLRHTAATLMYQTGKVDVRVLKDILGHEQLNTTQIYTHISDKGMEDAVKNNPLANKGRK